MKAVATATAAPVLPVSKALQLPVPENASALANVPRDMREFCTAAAATACLYVPAGLYVQVDAISMVTADLLIDKKTCLNDTGEWFTDSPTPSCVFTYPTRAVNSFDPGSTPTFGFNFSDGCNLQFDTVADLEGRPRGFPQG